jgi:predicted nucleic acid-binding protein
MIDSDSIAVSDAEGPIYLDASGLAKLYFHESDSDELNARLAGRRDLVVSDLSITEVASSLVRRNREGAVTADEVRRAHRTMLGHLDDGTFRRVELTIDRHRVAERFLMQLTQISLRAADALHLSLCAGADCATLLTYDLRLAAAARAVGLIVSP